LEFVSTLFAKHHLDQGQHASLGTSVDVVLGGGRHYDRGAKSIAGGVGLLAKGTVHAVHAIVRV